MCQRWRASGGTSSVATGTQIPVRVLHGFDQLGAAADAWNGLLSRSTDVVFLTLEWQREWWRAFGDEQLLLVVAERDGEPQAIAPLFAAKEMLFLVGSDGSDYLDFIGALDEATLATMLDAARGELAECVGVGLYHIPLRSPTTSLLPGVAERMGLKLFREGGMRAPYAELDDPLRVKELIASRNLRKAEARMQRAGPLRFATAAADELDEWLELLFEQYGARWGDADSVDANARSFYRAIVHRGHREGWLSFSMLEWSGAPVAFDISLIRGGRHLSYMSSRDPSISAHSPGRILQRYVVKAAVDAGARVFDYGLGEEEYKLRDASGVDEVANWFLYP
jgi:CelD/BcsL family acetyltransferase involved in cellulose biosynthesis